ncbi:MAG: hypothetical protein GY714_05680 [Desulfobacterales bacterium]|nr:hypothetical protein [Desulfobacterales bacterium]
MPGRILKLLISSIIISFALTIVGLIVHYFIKDYHSLQNVLFIVGLIAMGWFCLGLLGFYKLRGNYAYLLGRSVSNQSSVEGNIQDFKDIRSLLTYGLNWFIAGLLVWLVMILV